MRIEGETREVKRRRRHRDSARAASTSFGTPASETLRLLCCCAPAYEHDDTIITEKV